MTGPKLPPAWKKNGRDRIVFPHDLHGLGADAGPAFLERGQIAVGHLQRMVIPAVTEEVAGKKVHDAGRMVAPAADRCGHSRFEIPADLRIVPDCELPAGDAVEVHELKQPLFVAYAHDVVRIIVFGLDREQRAYAVVAETLQRPGDAARFFGVRACVGPAVVIEEVNPAAVQVVVASAQFEFAEAEADRLGSSMRMPELLFS